MKRVEKKIWPEFYDAVASGKQKHQCRLNDFDIDEGDTLVLREWDPEIKEYTGRELERRVTHVYRYTHDDFTRFHSEEEIFKKGLQVISLDEVS
jgi:ketosteroid isomerase-like protein